MLWYIRKQRAKLFNVLKLQKEKNLFVYKAGDILLIHLPLDKTKYRFKKRRQNFDELAVFKHYLNGNVMCELIKKIVTGGFKLTLVPIFYTRFVCHGIEDLPLEFRNKFHFILQK
jgi:hypothetical protein